MAGGMSKSCLEQDGAAHKGKPHIWIQWKGTDVCCDIYCECGAHLHHDGDFMYFVKCPRCQTVWEVGSHVALYRVTDDRADDRLLSVAEPEAF
jgi:phage FluMu protein Com